MQPPDGDANLSALQDSLIDQSVRDRLFSEAIDDPGVGNQDDLTSELTQSFHYLDIDERDDVQRHMKV